MHKRCIVGERCIENVSDDQQKEDRDAMSDFSAEADKDTEKH